uniref:Uncharacterized protein n=1 Tax=Micrurus lemniscatus lemniscatus TaxID=129467 RepID=A0A2D4I7Q1_MICLE
MSRNEKILGKNKKLATRNKKNTKLTELKPELFLLGIIKGEFSKKTKYIILHIATAARIAFAQFWKWDNISSEELVIQKVLECIEMDKFTLELKGKEESEYYMVWDKLYNWIKNRNKD